MSEKAMKLNYKKTILMGFAFMASSVAWGIYDPYVTTILNKMLGSSEVIAGWGEAIVAKFPGILDFLSATGEDVGSVAGGFTLVPLFIGIIMTFDNVFGVIFQPTFGKLSDRCHTRFGKRRPFIFFGAPAAALFFILIPKMTTVSALMLCVIMYVFIMSLWRAPAVALMPDLTPPALRSEGNAVINLMGGVGGALATIAATIVCLIGGFDKATQEDEYIPWVFVFGAIAMLISTVVLFFFVKEPDSRLKAVADAKSEKEAHEAAKAAAKAEKQRLKNITLSGAERKSLIFMLAGLFFLFCGANSIQTFFALFAAEILGLSVGQASTIMLIFIAATALAALPAGKAGKKLGRKKTIIAGLSAFLAAFVIFLAIFAVMLGNENLNVSSYLSANSSYTTVSNTLNDFNNAREKDAKAAGTEFTADDRLTLTAYIEYLGLTDADKAPESSTVSTLVPAQFDEYITSNIPALRDSVITLATDTLGKTEVKTFGEALGELDAAVMGVRKILNILIYPVLIIAGAANMFITVNTLPLVLDIGGIEKVGTFTGYYYTATFSAQIATPIVYGIVRMFTGTYASLFVYCPICFVLSMLAIIMVKHGEARVTEEEPVTESAE